MYILAVNPLETKLSKYLFKINIFICITIEILILQNGVLLG